MEQGDIVIINFPFTSLVDAKVRPAVIISNNYFNQGPDIILLAISTKEGYFSEPLSEQDLSEGKLLKKSYIRFANILSLEKKLVLKKVGRLKNVKIKKMIALFNKFIKI